MHLLLLSWISYMWAMFTYAVYHFYMYIYGIYIYPADLHPYPPRGWYQPTDKSVSRGDFRRWFREKRRFPAPQTLTLIPHWPKMTMKKLNICDMYKNTGVCVCITHRSRGNIYIQNLNHVPFSRFFSIIFGITGWSARANSEANFGLL